jgi:RNA polymerase sigma factor (sigma-70 family)
MSPWISDLFLRSQSDQRLVTLVAAGHERAFGTIVERYRPELQAVAQRLSSDGRGEDIVQQAFLSAFVALRAGTRVHHLRGWLYQIVRNAAANSHRTRELPLQEIAGAGETLEDLVARRALALTALAEVARLPRRQRDALVGTALEGLTRSEIASSMEISEGAVRQLVHRARLALRSTVTAVTPLPLARWAAAGAPAASAAGDLAAGALPGAGLVVKIGALLTTAALASGVVAMRLQPADPRGQSKPTISSGGKRTRPAAEQAVALASVAARAVFTSAPSDPTRPSGPVVDSSSARPRPGWPAPVEATTHADRPSASGAGPERSDGGTGERRGEGSSNQAPSPQDPVTGSSSGPGDASSPSTGGQDSGSKAPGPDTSTASPGAGSDSGHGGSVVWTTASVDSSPPSATASPASGAGDATDQAMTADASHSSGGTGN